MSGFVAAVTIVCTVVLALSAALALLRMVRGPNVLNRLIALDVIVSVLVCALGLEAAATRHSTTLPILVSLSLVGFVGSVSAARFVARDRDAPPGTPPGAEGPARREGTP